MTSIAVIGANGQVGSEVTLLLSRSPGISVVPIVRSRLGAELLERCGVPCRIGSLASESDAKRLLEDCQLVADFSLPTGLPSQVRAAIHGNVRGAVQHAPGAAPYVYISSTMAFGSGDSGRYQDLLFARTPYAALKRFGERSARRLGRAQGRPVYVLRLGQVFGELQSVSRALLASATPASLALLDGQGGHSPSDAVFCATIARALTLIASGQERPGTYSLLEAPEWTWRELYAFHAQQAGVAPRFIDDAPSAGVKASLASLLARLTRGAGKQLIAHRDLLVAHLLPHHAGLEQRIKARHLLRRARAEIMSPERREVVSLPCCRGPVPGRRLQSLRTELDPTRETTLAVRQLLHQRLGPESHNYR